MDQEEKTLKVDKKAIIGFVILVLAVIGVIVFSFFGGNLENSYHGEGDHGVDNDSSADDGQFVSFRNLDFMGDFLGSGASAAMGVLRDEIIGNITESEGETNTLTATMPGSSLVKEIYFPFDTCSFNLNISDGRAYSIKIASQKDKYFGVMVRDMDSAANSPVELYVMFLEMTQDRDNAVNSIVNWAKSNYSGELLLTTKELF